MFNPNELSSFKEYLTRYQAGDKGAGMQILKMAHFKTIIGRECAKWIPQYELDELEHICHIIILKILQQFKMPPDSNGGHILSYINKFLGKRLQDGIKKLHPNDDKEVSLQSPVSEDGSLTLQDVLVDEGPSLDDIILFNERRDEVRAAIRKLTPNQQKIIYLHFYENMTHEEIAKELGVSRPAITQSIQGSIKKLRTLLEE